MRSWKPEKVLEFQKIIQGLEKYKNLNKFAQMYWKMAIGP
jgi:hypothetical protein